MEKAILSKKGVLYDASTSGHMVKIGRRYQKNKQNRTKKLSMDAHTNKE